ncbi:MAG: AsmA-like C-terminal region-containing protein, partial [Methyloligellaceae bacterium]
PDPPTGEAVFTVQTSTPAALEFLDQERLGYIKEVGFKPAKSGGDVSAEFRIIMPLLKDLKFRDLKMEGNVKLRKAKFARLFGSVGIDGGSVDFGITEKAIDAQGVLRLNGVPTKVTWQRIFAASTLKQPPLRLYGILDAAARKRLGLSVDHMIVGNLPVEITIRPSPSGSMKLHLHADVGSSELVLTNVGWRKAPGRAAVIDFDIVKNDRGLTNLENFKIVGNDIAIDGRISVDAQNSIKEFHFKKFSLNVITQLEISGKRTNGRLWDVSAKGETYDGRQFFRSLFSAGQLTEKKLASQQSRSNLRLRAEIGTVVGYSGTTLKQVSVDIVKRDGKLAVIKASGKLNGRKPVGVQLLDKPGERRELRAHAEDAGDAFRLIGFYPSIEGGEAKLVVDLDGRGAAEKTGTLWVRDFNILGDPVVSEVLASSFQEGDLTNETSTPKRRRGQRVQRQKIFFDYMQVPFSVGSGQFVFHDSIIKGPALGATMRGQVDFKRKNIDLSGTYSPLYGLNSVPGQLPIIGPLLGGSRGEGLIGITFAVQGKMESPRVLVNPVSMVAPGFLRQLLFDFGRQQGRVSPARPDAVGSVGAPTNRRR